MSGLSGALCVGRHALFESVEPIDHLEAAAICAQCPVRRACLELLHGQASSMAAYGGGPVGTWAGKLVGTTRKPREHGTERGYQQHRHYGEVRCGECRAAHTAHVARTWKQPANPQVNPTNRTSERVESGPKARVPHRRANDGEAARSSTRPRGA